MAAVLFAIFLSAALLAAPATAQEEGEELPDPSTLFDPDDDEGGEPGDDEEGLPGLDDDDEAPEDDDGFGDDDDGFGDDDDGFGDDDGFSDGFEEDDEFGDSQVSEVPEGGVAAGGAMTPTPLMVALLALALAGVGGAALTWRRAESRA